jgi:hypothetical protein
MTVSEKLHDALNPVGRNCNICNSEYDAEENWIHGYVGIIPVAFCEICYNGVVEMVHYLEDEFLEDEED